MSHNSAEVPLATATTIFPEVDIPLPYALLTAVFLAFCWQRCQQEDSWLLFCLTGLVPWLLRCARHLFSILYDLLAHLSQEAFEHRIFLTTYILTPTFSLLVLAFLTSLTFTYLDTYIPFCDPWRDSSLSLISYIPFFPFTSLLSSSLLYMCPRPGLARSSTIANFNTFAQLSNITAQLSDSLLDYRDLHSLCEEARYGAVWLDNEMAKLSKPTPAKGSKAIVKPHPQSLLNFQTLLYQVGSFEGAFLHNRTTALKEMRADLAQFDEDLASRSVSYTTRSHLSSLFSRSHPSRAANGKPHHEDIISYNLAQTAKYNHTLSSKIFDAGLLLEEIRDMKQKIELIGDNIIYVRMLGSFAAGRGGGKSGIGISGKGKNGKGVLRSERQRRYFAHVTGVEVVRDAEMEVFERVMSRLVGSSGSGNGKPSAGLELAVFEMLPQVREARRVLKKVVGVREGGGGEGGGRAGSIGGGGRGKEGVEWTDISPTPELKRKRVGNESIIWEWSPETTRREEEELKRGLTRQLDELARAAGGESG